MTRREEIEREAEEYARDVFVVDKIGNFGINMNEYDAFIDGAEWADAHPVHYDGKAYLYVLHKGVGQGKKEMLDKVKSLIKEWELCTSSEAKYKVEAYKELMEILEKEDKE